MTSDKQFQNRKAEIIKSLEDEFSKFKVRYKEDYIAKKDFDEKLKVKKKDLMK